MATLCNHVYNGNNGLICINLGWPPFDLRIITFCIVTWEQMKIETGVSCENYQD